MANERYESVWDAICDTPEESERMREWSRQKMIDRVHAPDDQSPVCQRKTARGVERGRQDGEGR